MDTAQIDNHLDGFVRYLTVLEGLAGVSIEMYRRKVDEFFGWLAGNDDLRPVDQLARQDVERYLEWCFYRGNNNQTRHTKLTALRKYIRFLRYEGHISQDITTEIPKPRIHRAFVQKFTREEVLGIFRAIDFSKQKGVRDGCIFILAAFCGLRAGEIAKLRLECIQDDGRLIDVVVPNEIAKRGRGRTVDLWAVPSRDLRQYVAIRLGHGAKASDPLLVTYRYKRPGLRPFNASMLDAVAKFYSRLAAIRKARVTMHMFRATHASDCRHVKGYDTPAIARRLGHASIATTDRYLPDRSRIRRTYNSFAEYWREYERLRGGADGNKQPLE